MNLIQIFAFLSVLSSFGVSSSTVAQIHDILIPVASTTPVTFVPVIQSPIIENAPVYFGSVIPTQPIQTVDNTTPTPKSVVQSVQMDNSSTVLKDITATGEYIASTPLTKNYSFEVRDTNGNIVRNYEPFTILVDGKVYDTQSLNSVALDKDRNVKYGKVFPVELPSANSVVSIEYNGVNYLPQ